MKYATRADLAVYLEDGLPEGYSDGHLDRVLELASADVDMYASYWPWPSTAMKFATGSDPVVWRTAFTNTSYQAAIVEATCAQAEYRLAKGEQFFVEVQRAEVDPETGGTTREPRFGPKAREALRRSGFRAVATTAILGP